MTDDQIVKSFIGEYGAGIFLAKPNAIGWVVPYALVLAGILAILAFIRKYRKPKPLTDLGAVRIEDPELAKYQEQIEKDLANLE